jgi:hypothetical protein
MLIIISSFTYRAMVRAVSSQFLTAKPGFTPRPVKGKSKPERGLRGLEGSGRIRLPDF